MFEPPSDAHRPLPPPPPPPPSMPAPPKYAPLVHGVIPPSPTRGLRTATITLFWCVVGASWLVLLAAINRRRVFDDVDDLEGFVNEFQDADDALAAAEFLEAGLALAALIVLSIWSLRTARHVRSYGGHDVSPGLACGGWYIPFGNFVVPFVQLRRVASRRDRRRTWINWWQGLFIAEGVAGVSFQRLGDIESASSPDDFLNRMSGQIGLGAFTAVLLTATAYVAMRATRDVEGS
jgi:hypothetical protein